MAADPVQARLDGLDPQRRALAEKLAARRRLASGPRGTGSPTADAAGGAASDGVAAGLVEGPLTVAQQQLWFLHQLDPDRCDYHIAARLSFSGPCATDALGAAVQDTVDRHGALRTDFVVGADGQPVQRQHPQATIEVDVVPVAAGGIDAAAVAFARTPFDLSRAPLVRARVFAEARDLHHLVVVAHHLVCDGRSVSVLLADLAAAYHARTAGTPTPAEPAPSFLAVATAEASPAAADALDRRVAAWAAASLPLPAALRVPGAGPTSAALAGAVAAVGLEADAGTALRGLASDLHTTPTVVLLALWAAVLGRSAGQAAFTVGVPSAGRTGPGTDAVVGLFATTLVVPVDLAPHTTVGDLVADLRRRAAMAWNHDGIPFERLVRAAGRPDLITASFSFQDFNRELVLDGTQVATHDVDLGTVLIDVGLVARFDGDALVLTVHAADRVGGAALARALVAAVHDAVDAMVAGGPSLPLDRVTVVERLRPAVTNCSPTQALMVLGQQLHPEDPLYNQVLDVTIHGPLDPDRFRSAFAAVVASTDALRLRVAMDRGVPRQEVGRSGPDLVVLDGEPFDPALASEPIDPARGVARACLVREAADRWRFVLVVHHVAVDARANQLVWQRLTRAYDDPHGTLPAAPGPLAVAAHDRAVAEGAAGEAAARFWRERLADPVAPPTPYGRALPGTGGRLTVERHAADLHPAAVDALVTLHRSLGHRAFGREGAAFAVLAAAVAVQVHLASGAPRVRVGVPFHNRATRERKQAVAAAMTVVPITVDVGAPGDTFADVVARVEAEVRAVMPHAGTPPANRDPAHGWSVVVNVHGFAFAPIGGMPVQVRIANAGCEFEPLVVHLQSADGLHTAELAVDARPAAFGVGGAARVGDQILAVLHAGVADPHAPLSSIVLESAADRARRARRADPGAPPAFTPVADLVGAQVARTPHAVALVDGAASITYAALWRRVDAQAARLRAALADGADSSPPAVAPPTATAAPRLAPAWPPVVLLATGRGADFVVGALAALRVGAAYAAVDPAWPDARWDAVGGAVRPAAVLASAGLAGRAARLSAALAVPTLVAAAPPDAVDPAPRPRVPAPAIHPEAPAFVLTTSGATGPPKPVLVDHGALAAYSADTARRFGLTPSDRVLQFASTAFDTVAEEVFPTLIAGATLVIRPEGELDDAPAFLRRSHHRQLTVIDLPTAYWHLLAAHPDAVPAAARLVVIGGEAARPDAVRRWCRHAPQAELRNTYGPTEATVVTLEAVLPPGWDGDVVPLGEPVGGAAVTVELPRPVEGLPGELRIGGHRLAAGYLHQPATTAERFVPDPSRPGGRAYRTGDLVAVGPDGALGFRGRVDRQVKVRGHRVELAEVEAALRAVPGVADAVALPDGADPRAPSADRLVAVITVVSSETGATGETGETGETGATGETGETGPDPTEVVRRLAARLPAPAVPARVVSVPALPVTPVGKVDLDALALLAAPGAASAGRPTEAPARPPATAVERLVAGAWAEVLGLDPDGVGLDDDFFAAGGHSLLAAVLVARLADATGATVALRTLFDRPRLGDLAAAVEQATRTAERRAAGAGLPALVATPRSGPADTPPPLTASQLRLWLLDRLAPGNPTFNVPAAVRLRGPLDVDALRWAFERLLARHDVLRTAFPEVDGRPVQQVAPVGAATFALPVHDLTALAPDEAGQRAALDDLARADALAPFTLATGPLVRAQVVRLAPDDHVVLVCLHHIVADGWSVGVAVRDLTVAYDAFRSADPSMLATLPPLPVQVADVARWEQACAAVAVSGAAGGAGADGDGVAWWVERLRGAPASLALPSDRPRPAVERFVGHTVGFALDPSASAGLRALADAHRTTPYAVWLAAYAVFLHRLAPDAGDLVVGTPVAGRSRAEVADLVGCFVNTLALRLHVSDADTLATVIDRTRTTVVEALDHQHVPFDRVVDALSPERTARHGVVFQTMFTFLNEPTRVELDRGSLTLEVLDIDRGTANRDLTVRVEDREAFTGHLEANADLYDRATVARLAAGFAALVDAAVRDPDAAVSGLAVPAVGADGTPDAPVDTAPPAAAATAATAATAASEGRRARSRAGFEAALGRGPATVDLAAPDAVRFTTGDPAVGAVPVTATPAIAGVDLASWVGSHRAAVEAHLLMHGAVLFRGFGPVDPDVLRGVAVALRPDLLDYDEPSTPRTGVGEGIYTSTEYPAAEAIMLHHEMAYADHFPRVLWFGCAVAAREGGATPIADGRVVRSRLDSDVVARFDRLGVRYQRTYTPNLDLSWQHVFGTDDPDQVARRCADQHIAFRWRDGGRVLHTTQVLPASVVHPESGERLWFNSAHMFHVAALPPSVAASLRSMLADDELPRHATFGDGTPIPDDVIAHIRDTYAAAAIRFAWAPGDLLLVDNLRTAHGREPFTGDRRVLVAMAGALQAARGSQ